MEKETLDHLVRVQDALEAMDDTSCITRADYIEVNKPSVQHLYASAWSDAKELVRVHGSLGKAAAYVDRRIQELGSN